MRLPGAIAVQNLPLIHRQLASDGLEQRTFAGTGLANNAEHLAGVEVKGDAIAGADIIVVFGQPVNF
jgi:hypothetical protein